MNTAAGGSLRPVELRERSARSRPIDPARPPPVVACPVVACPAGLRSSPASRRMGRTRLDLDLPARRRRLPVAEWAGPASISICPPAVVACQSPNGPDPPRSRSARPPSSPASRRTGRTRIELDQHARRRRLPVAERAGPASISIYPPAVVACTSTATSCAMTVRRGCRLPVDATERAAMDRPRRRLPVDTAGQARSVTWVAPAFVAWQATARSGRRPRGAASVPAARPASPRGQASPRRGRRRRSAASVPAAWQATAQRRQRPRGAVSSGRCVAGQLDVGLAAQRGPARVAATRCEPSQ